MINGQLYFGTILSHNFYLFYFANKNNFSSNTFFISQGDWMWQFSAGLYLVHLSDGHLRLAAVFGFTGGTCVLLFGGIIGDWVDKNGRLKGKWALSTIMFVNPIHQRMHDQFHCCQKWQKDVRDIKIMHWMTGWLELWFECLEFERSTALFDQP